MIEKNGKGSESNDNLKNKIRVLCVGISKPKQTADDVDKIDVHIDFEDIEVPDKEKALRKIYSRLNRRKRTRKIALVAVACVLMLMAGIAVVANTTDLFNRFFKPNEIKFSTDIEVQENNSEFKMYNNIEEMLYSINLQIPLLTTFPEELTVSNIIVTKNNEITTIGMIYADSSQEEKVKLTYKYYEKPVNSTGETGINETYDYIGNFRLLGTLVDVYSDMERRLAVWNFEKFIIKLEASYSKAQLETMMKSMEIHK